MSIENSNPVSLQLSDGRRTSTVTFPPKHLFVDKQGKVLAFILPQNNQVYFWASEELPERAHIPVWLKKLVAPLVGVGASIQAAKVGMRTGGPAGGVAGVVVGFIAGATLEEILEHFPEEKQYSKYPGYYSNSDWAFDGPLHIRFI